MAFAFVSLLAVQAEASPVPPSYSIDAIYDDVNTTNWFDASPTFVGGQTYNITVEGSGVRGSEQNPAGSAYMGLFMEDTPVDWTTNTDSPIISDNVPGINVFPGDNWLKEYTLTGVATAPLDMETGTGQAFAWLDPSVDFTQANVAYSRANTKRFADVNFQAAECPVPEPGSISLLGLGLLGLIGRFRKRA